MIHHSKSLELEIVEFKYFRDRAPLAETIPYFSNPKNLASTKVQDISIYDISLERS